MYMLGLKIDPRNVISSRRHVLGNKVDLIRNVTLARYQVLGHKVDLIRNVILSRFRILAVKFTLLLFLNRFWTLLMFLKRLSFRFGP